MTTGDTTSNNQARIRLIGTPYHAGVRGVSMGRGPLLLLDEHRVPKGIRKHTSAVDVRWVDRDDPDTATARLPMGEQMPRHVVQNWEVQRLVADAIAEGRLPILSSGNCNSSLGVIGGINDNGIGMIWLDAHADSSTPETSTSGLFDGMPVAIIAGQCWKAMRESIPGFHTIPPERIVSVGMHGLVSGNPGPIGHIVDRGAASRLGSWEKAFAHALENLAEHTDRVYLHVDTDVLEPDIAQVSNYTASGGLTPEEVKRTIEMVSEKFDVLAINFTAFDPDVDPRALPVVEDIMVNAAFSIIHNEGTLNDKQ